MDIVERLVKFHEEQGVPYSFLSDKLGMNQSSLRAVVAGRMKLKDELEQKLDEYLKIRGY